ncbi:hypothetical protein B0H11DRAFT_271666 [Mycena galericulata]|nr:hypothetical protein B0H11DRAFT_271666 [Mycena galericulata]
MSPKSTQPDSENPNRHVVDDGLVNLMTILKDAGVSPLTLESFSDTVPAEVLSEFVDVASGVMKTWQNASALEGNVKGLQQDISGLALIIANNAIDSRARDDIETKIKDINCILAGIIEHLNEIMEQNTQILSLCRGTEHWDSLSADLEQLNLSHQVSAERLLERSHSCYSDVRTWVEKIKETLSREMLDWQREDMPPPCETFYGRQVAVDRITALLSSESTSNVCIGGPGGMGKTAVALAVIHSPIIGSIFPRRYWVPCEKASSPELLCRILYTQLGIKPRSYDSPDTLVDGLNASQERQLLLLDNFETPWFSGHDQDKLNDILHQLARLPHIAVLVTITSAFAPLWKEIEWQHRELASLDVTAARETFVHLCPWAADAPMLDELLSAVGRIPLAITLMAANARASGVPPKELLEEWEKSGTGMIPKMDRTISLSLHREVIASNSEALTLLAILSMLPAGITRNAIQLWAPALGSFDAAFNSLQTAALVGLDVNFGNFRLFVYPTIKSYMSRQNLISPQAREQVHDACYRFVLDHTSTPDDAKFKADMLSLASEETNIQSLLMNINVHALHPKAIDALVAFGHYQLRIRPSTTVASHALEIALAAHDNDHAADPRVVALHIAEAHDCLGQIFLALDRYEEAHQYFEDARRGFRNLPGGADLHRAGACSMQLAETWRLMDHTFESSDEIRSLVLEAQADLSHDPANRYHIALSLLGLADFLWWANCPDDALENLSAAQAIFEELERPASTSECLNLTAKIYFTRKEYTKALVIVEEALRKAEQSGDRSLIVRVLSSNARCLIAVSAYDAASDIVEKSLAGSRTLGSPLGIAQNLELFAYNCAAKMELSAAQLAYEGALLQYSPVRTMEIGGGGEVRCKYNFEQLDGLEEIHQTDFMKLRKPWPLC